MPLIRFVTEDSYFTLTLPISTSPDINISVYLRIELS